MNLSRIRTQKSYVVSESNQQATEATKSMTRSAAARLTQPFNDGIDEAVPISSAGVRACST